MKIYKPDRNDCIEELGLTYCEPEYRWIHQLRAWLEKAEYPKIAYIPRDIWNAIKRNLDYRYNLYGYDEKGPFFYLEVTKVYPGDAKPRTQPEVIDWSGI